MENKNTTMDKKYYYFVAQVQTYNGINLLASTWGTTSDDFPLMYIRKRLAEQENVPRSQVVISFYKEITENNYKAYNPETLQVEHVKTECEFKAFDKVLVRDAEGLEWYANYFSHYRGKDKDFPYACFGNNFRYCIPYEGNEHLLGTTDPYTEGGME